jgi:hypothetical protein
MKKYLLTFLLSVAVLGTAQVPVFAQTSSDNLLFDVAKESGYNESTNSQTASETVGKIIRIGLGLLGIIFLVLTVYAGYLWMTAAGNDEQVTKATGILKMAVIGLIIILSAYSLSYFVLDKIFEATL